MKLGPIENEEHACDATAVEKRRGRSAADFAICAWRKLVSAKKDAVYTREFRGAWYVDLIFSNYEPRGATMRVWCGAYAYSTACGLRLMRGARFDGMRRRADSGENKFYKRPSEALHMCLNFREWLLTDVGWLINECRRCWLVRLNTWTVD